MISIILNVGPLPRLQLTKHCLSQTLASAGRNDFELLVCDNGTNCQPLADFIKRKKPVYFRRNSENQGNYQMLNQLLLRAQGDYIAYIAGDIEYPDAWLNILVKAAQAIPETGMAGFYCVQDMGEPTIINGIHIRKVGRVFGGGLWFSHLQDSIGYFCEHSLYGIGDSDWGARIKEAGLLNYYVDYYQSYHQGHDVEETSEYRQMKTAELKKAARRHKGRNVYVPAPEQTQGDIQ